MYETMVYWETAHTIPDQPYFLLEWTRQWQAAEKIVYSRTLAEPSRAEPSRAEPSPAARERGSSGSSSPTQRRRWAVLAIGGYQRMEPRSRGTKGEAKKCQRPRAMLRCSLQPVLRCSLQ
jgi:hypothetical protein